VNKQGLIFSCRYTCCICLMNCRILMYNRKIRTEL